jgi:membrane protease subunit (stomatin/prohibitin family)
MNAIGDMAAYQGYQLGQAMPVAAANPAGGLAGAGVGLGMGLGIAQTMGVPSTQGGGSPPAQSPPPPPAPQWHLAVNGQTQGPFTPEQITAGIAAGQVRGDTLVWSAGMENWTAANQIPVFAAAFRPVPPPPPVPPTNDE